MKIKKIMLITLLLLAVLTIGAVSAADNADALAVDGTGDNQVVEAPVDNSDVGLAPSDFNVTFIDGEVDINDDDTVVVRFYWPEDASQTVTVGVDGGSSSWYDKSAGQTYQDVTLGNLYIFEPGTYNLTVKYNYETVIATGTLKVTKTYTADDFIGIMTDVNEYEKDVVNVWDDEGLNGFVTVYANGVQAYSQNLVAEPSQGILIYVENLTGNFNGQYTIKAVYKKANGKEYSKESIVTFTGVGSPDKTTITASAMTVVYGDNKYVVATLKDSNGNVISDVNVKIKVMGVEYPVATDKNGQVKQSVGSLDVGKQTVTFTFDGNANYAKSTKSVTVTVNKAAPKLTAAKKTFKKSVKTKKYTVTLKTNQNKVMKSVWVTLNVNKKNLKVKTNAKGQATFKITNLNKKGTFTATVKYAGNSYYKAVTAKPKITVK